MKITLLKRFEFAASRHVSGKTRQIRIHGHNFILWVGVTGPIDRATGMVINIVDLKQIVAVILDRYDHRYLNAYISEPSTLNVAVKLWEDLISVMPEFVELAVVYLLEDGGDAAFVGKQKKAIFVNLDSSTSSEKYAFGALGRFYRLEIELGNDILYYEQKWLGNKVESANEILNSCEDELSPFTVGRKIINSDVEIKAVRIWTSRDLFVQHSSNLNAQLSRVYHFFAAHRLNSIHFSAEENRQIYGKCNRLEPHGHSYFFQVKVGGQYFSNEEILAQFANLDEIAGGVIKELNYTYLDRDIEVFQRKPSTGENIALYLNSVFKRGLENLVAVQVWETPNNLFVITENEGFDLCFYH